MDKDEEEKKGTISSRLDRANLVNKGFIIMAERTFSSGTNAEKEPRSLVPLLVGEEPWNPGTLVPEGNFFSLSPRRFSTRFAAWRLDLSFAKKIFKKTWERD